ncbi:MAG: VOC family protein [Actinomycetota bacterium]
MRIQGLHHAQICIPEGSEEDAKAFYCGVLGLPEVTKPSSLEGRGGFWLQVGARQVHVGTEGQVDRTATKAHLAYEVTEIDSWRDHLHQHDVDVEDGVPIPGFFRFEFRDPFGNRVEFIEPVS